MKIVWLINKKFHNKFASEAKTDTNTIGNPIYQSRVEGERLKRLSWVIRLSLFNNNEMVQQQRTSIGLRQTAKSRLDENRAPGQCYDGFICQLMDLWEKNKERRISY